MSKPGEIRYPKENWTKELDQAIEDTHAQMLTTEAQRKVITELTNTLTDHKLPGPFVYSNTIWMPTNTYFLTYLVLSEFECQIGLTLLWKNNTDEHPVPNPLGYSGKPAGFGPGFDLPHLLEKTI